MAKMRVLLAYSGGLDTSIIVPWLKENYDCDVVCVAGDVGQGEELEPLHEKAKKCGAEKLYIDVRMGHPPAVTGRMHFSMMRQKVCWLL